MPEAHLGGHRIARQPHCRNPAEHAKGEGLAGLHAHLPKAHVGAFVCESGLDDVEVSDADPTCGEDEVWLGVESAAKGCSGALERVSGDSGVDGMATRLRDQRHERGGVAAVDLRGRAGFAGGSELVSGGDDGDDRLAGDDEAAEALARGQHQAAGVEASACGQKAVSGRELLGLDPDVPTGPNAEWNHDVIAVFLHVLPHDDGIGAVGDDPTRHYAAGGARFDHPRRHVAGSDGLEQA